MPGTLKALGQLFQPKESEPDTTPSLRDALKHPAQTVGSYYVTPSIRAIIKEVLETVIHGKGQGYWVRAEYGAGKTHFIAALTLLLTRASDDVWNSLHDDALRTEYRAAVGKKRLFPVTFSLLGAGEADAGDNLMRSFEKEIRDSLPGDLRDKVPVISEELAAEWYEQQAGTLIKRAISDHFAAAHGMTPEEFRQRDGVRKLGAEILAVAQQQGLTIDVKAAFRDRFSHIYKCITQLGGYEGLLFVVDEFRSWQDRHEGKPSFEEGLQVLETLAYYLPVEEHMNIVTVVASQGDCPQKLMGSGQGDRFIVRELLSGRDQTDYGKIVCFRVRDLLPGKAIDVEEYFRHCRHEFRFLKQTPQDYFEAIFPFQPRCFDILRRVTQSYERYGLPSTRSGIHIAWETITHNGLLASSRLAVLSDLLNSDTLATGLRAKEFRSSYESYREALESLDTLPLDDEERDAARRVIGTLYLWSVVNADAARGLTLAELAEATLASLEGITPEDTVLDLVTRLKSDIPQIRHDKEKGARFEITETDGKKPERVFGTFKKKGKADVAAQDDAWRQSLFWDFKALEGAGSAEGFEGGFFDGYGARDAKGDLVLPHTTLTKASPGNLKVQYGGEIVVADRWQDALGETWSNRPETHFRIVYLTASHTVDRASLADSRIAVCVPAALSVDTRENLAEFVACELMLAHYNDREYPNEGAMRDWAKNRRRGARAAILKNQIEEYRRGEIVTQKDVGLPASQFFLAPKAKGKREESLAGQLLEKAYDRPRFNPRELKREFTDVDAKKVFHGLFSKSPTNADTSARENFAPGLGLVAKNNPTTFAPQPDSAAAYIQERVANQMDIAVAELVRELCGCPYGMTESMVQLAVLCAVRAGQPAIVLADLNPTANLKLTNGREPPGKRLTGRSITLLEWNNRLERAFLGARVKLSDEKPFNDVLAYAQALDPNLTPAHTPDEEVERNRELCFALTDLKADLPTSRETLRKLAGVLGGALPHEATEVFARLETIAETNDYQEFHALVREHYATPELFKQAHELYQRARKLNARYPDLQFAKAYLDGMARLNDPEIGSQVNELRSRLEFDGLWKNETLPAIAVEQFGKIKAKYSLAYRKAHRQYHAQMESLHGELSGLDERLTVIQRLNSLDLGAAVAPGLAQQVHALTDKVRPCALKDNCAVDDQPLCNVCHWDGVATPPVEETHVLVRRVQDAAGELCKRVAQDAIRKILEDTGRTDIGKLLDMITASRVEELARVLTADMVDDVKAILAAANIEHRDVKVAGLIEDFAAVEEEQIDDLLRKLRSRLQAEFDKAKKETAGKKRIRFFLR